MGKNVAIVGGSAAGLFTANLLANQGCKVRLYEAGETIDPCPRTLIVTSYMRDLLGSVCKPAVINKIRRFELFADGRLAVVPLSSPDLVIDRSKLIRSLVSLVQAKGVKVLTGSRFFNLKQAGKRLAFTVSYNGATVEESADILIGADGAVSRVARSAGWPRQSTVPVIQAVVELPKDMPADTTRVWFAPEDTSYFYWLIPHSQTQAVLGLVGGGERESRRSIEGFLERKHLVPVEFQSAKVPRYTRSVSNHRKVAGGHIYLVGDAAGHVKVSTLGGIVTGFRGVIATAETVLNGRWSPEFKALRRELDLHLLIRKALNRFSDEDYARLLDLLTPSVRRSLGLINRDAPGKLLFHVFAKQPRLLLLALRAFLIKD